MIGDLDNFRCATCELLTHSSNTLCRAVAEDAALSPWFASVKKGGRVWHYLPENASGIPADTSPRMVLLLSLLPKVYP